MKRLLLLLLTALLCGSAGLASGEARVAESEIPVFGPSTETNPPQLVTVGNIKPGVSYEVLEIIDQRSAHDQETWVQAWLDTYVLHRIRYDSSYEERTVEGYIVADYLPQDVTAVPVVTQEYGQLVTIEGRSVKALTFEMVDKRALGYELAQPPSDALSMEEALRCALDALLDEYDETEAALRRFHITFGYWKESDSLNAPCWQFVFENALNPMDGYAVYVHSPDGEIVGISGPGDGVG